MFFSIQPHTTPDGAMHHSTPGMHSELSKLSDDNATLLAMYVAAHASFLGYQIRKDNSLNVLNHVLPHAEVQENLKRLKISLTPFVVYDEQNCPLAIINDDGRMYFAQNVPVAKQKELLDGMTPTGLSALDSARVDRIRYYLQTCKLSAPASFALEPLTQETGAILKKKCVSGIPIPGLRTVTPGSDWASFPIFDSTQTVRVLSAGSDMCRNPDVPTDASNRCVLLPVHSSFTELLNSGEITNFTYNVTSVPASKEDLLDITVCFTLDGENFRHFTRRKAEEAALDAMLSVSFPNHATMVFLNSHNLRIHPVDTECQMESADNVHWTVAKVSATTDYVSISHDNTYLGMVKLPKASMASPPADQVDLCVDLGDTSFCCWIKVDGNPARPLTFDTTDITPLVAVQNSSLDSISNHYWFAAFNGTARSISQVFTTKNGASTQFAPFSTARPYLNNDENGYTVARTVQNGLYSGFKSEGLLRSAADVKKAAAYDASIAGIFMMGLAQALRHSGNVHLRLSYPHGNGILQKFKARIQNALELLKNAIGFSFAGVHYYTEAGMTALGIEYVGVNNTLGAKYQLHVDVDVGGGTTDVAVTTSNNERFMLPAIPFAGRSITISSLLQVARKLSSAGNPLIEALNDSKDPNKNRLKLITEKLLIPELKNELENELDGSTDPNDLRDKMQNLLHNVQTQEQAQTILDYIAVQTSVGDASSLLRYLICIKTLLLQDMVLHNTSSFFAEEDLQAQTLYLLMLGNGCRSVNLCCPDTTSLTAFEQALQQRACSYIGEKAKIGVVHNQKPKTEVITGLAQTPTQEEIVFTPIEKGNTVDDVKDLMNHQEQALCRLKDVRDWLIATIADICGDLQPYYIHSTTGGIQELFADIMEDEDCIAALLHTIRNENGRLSELHKESLTMAIDLWIILAICDSVDRKLSTNQSVKEVKP